MCIWIMLLRGKQKHVKNIVDDLIAQEKNTNRIRIHMKNPVMTKQE